MVRPMKWKYLVEVSLGGMGKEDNYMFEWVECSSGMEYGGQMDPSLTHQFYWHTDSYSYYSL